MSSLGRENLKILKSEDTSDFPDGGGRITNKEVIDGKSNDLFLDIPDTARAYGDLDLVKVFPAVVSENNEPLLGGVFSLGELPDDPTVNITMFTTKDWFDRRKDAIKYIENYLSPADRLAGVLYDRQLKTQRVIQIISEVDAPMPAIGKSYYLVQNEGEPNEFSQYVLASALTYEDRTFTIDRQKIKLRVITLDITTQLEYTFEGLSALDYYNGKPPIANARNTKVTDGARFYTTKKLSNDVAMATNKVKVDGIFTQIVPSSKIETPLSALNPSGKSTTLVPSGNTISFLLADYTPSPTQNIYVGVSILPNTLTISTSGGAIVDEGGFLVLNNVTIGNVNYTNGLISWLPTYTTRSDLTITFRPATAPKLTPCSTVIKVDETSRSFTYTMTLFPLPTPASLTVSFVVLGNVYTLEDKGDGVLKGFDSSFGTGNLNLETGDLILSLGAEPDVGSYILLNWGAANDVIGIPIVRSVKAGFEIPLEKSNDTNLVIDQNTITITWNDGESKTAKVGYNNEVTGDATGVYYPDKNYVYLEPNSLPAKGTNFKIDYSYTRITKSLLTANVSVINVVSNINYADLYWVYYPMLTSNFAVNVTFTLPLNGGSLTRGSLKFPFSVYGVISSFDWEKSNRGVKTLQVFDVPESDTSETGVLRCLEHPEENIGTVNYNTGVVIVTVTNIKEKSLIKYWQTNNYIPRFSGVYGSA